MAMLAGLGVASFVRYSSFFSISSVDLEWTTTQEVSDVMEATKGSGKVKNKQSNLQKR